MVLAFTEDSAKKFVKQYEDQAAEIVSRRREGTKRFSSGAYTGRYINDLNNFFIETQLGPNNNTLEMPSQGKWTQQYELRHLQNDIFEPSLSLDDEAKRGRFHVSSVNYFLVEFYATQSRVDHLVWLGKQPRKIE